MATCNVQSLLKNAACFGCLSPGEWDVLELQLLCEILSAGGGGGTSVLSHTFPLDNTTTYFKFAHGLGRTPTIIGAVFHCIADDANTGYKAGDEFETVAAVFDFNNITGFTEADATFVSALVPTPFVGNETSYTVQLKGTAQSKNNVSSFSNFQLKLYYL
jgi:hypothetical protein